MISTPAERALRAEICQVGQMMHAKGLVAATDGNISARLDAGRILVTPSGLCKGLMQPEHLLVVDLDGQVISTSLYAGRTQPRKPTSELPMHLEAYRQRPEIQAVVHAHPPTIVALSIAGISLAECLLPEVIVFLGLVPTAPYSTPSSTENAQAIRELIATHDAIILQRHGSLTVGRSPLDAYLKLETIEHSARIALILHQLGRHSTLPPDQVTKLIAQRQALGLNHPGDEAEFCQACGTCLTGPARLDSSTISSTSVDEALVREIVCRVLQEFR